MKKLIVFMLCMFIINMNLMFNVEAEDADGFEYVIENETLTITKCYLNTPTVEIPKTLEGYSVTGIGERIFDYWENINVENVIIPATVTEINECAFDDVGISSITVNSSNEMFSSSDGVLFNKNKTALVRYPEGKYLSNEYTIPGTVTSIEGCAFRNAPIGSIVIPSNVKRIGDYAFGMSPLREITLPDGLTYIGSNAFYSTSLFYDNSNWNDGMFYIGNYLLGINSDANSDLIVKEGTSLISVFWEWSCEFESLMIPESVNYIVCSGDAEIKTLYYNAIDCKTIIGLPLNYTKELVIGENVKNIPADAFVGCGDDDIAPLVIPEGVEKIGNNAFMDSGFKELYYNAKKCYVLSNNDIFDGCFDLEKIVIGNEVVEIPRYIFEYCDITEVTIPESVTEIGNHAFYYCRELKEVVIPDNVTQIGENAFYGTAIYEDETKYSNNVLYINNHLIHALDTLDGEYEIKEQTVTISPYAFEDCSKLTSISIPQNVKYIGKYAFRNCSSLEEINYNAENCEIECYYGNFNGSTVAYGAFADCINNLWDTITLNIGEKVRIIPDGAFSGAAVADFIIPDNVNCIGNYAFAVCGKVKSISIPDTVLSIGNKAFYGCFNLSDISLPDTALSIGYLAFEDTNYYDNLSNWENEMLYIGKHLIDIQTHSTLYKEYAIKPGTLTIADWALRYKREGIAYVIPESIVLIGSDVFYKDNRFPLYYCGTEEQWNNIILGENAYSDNVYVVYNYIPKIEIKSKTMYDTALYCKIDTDCGFKEQSAVAILAFYDKKGMVQVAIAPIYIKEGEVSVSFNFDSMPYETYKIFVWDENIAPLCEKFTLGK